ncbi:hypothetical protein EV10_1708 [Prochlorococcus marinus str. SS51]|nr:hypothetical protein EV08_1045 [Prochlorococcus marinus str. SS2]KGG31614.1 hypothetical protein EV10_1708 [Prochlorococcus marinus str. SS51]
MGLQVIQSIWNIKVFSNYIKSLELIHIFSTDSPLRLVHIF